MEEEVRSKLLNLYPLLGELPSARFKQLFKNVEESVFTAGTVLFDENQSCQGFPLLLSGSIRVIKSSASGRELQLYRVNVGETCILTSSCLLGRSHYHARGVVEQDATMVMLSPQTFKFLLAELVPFRYYIFRLFSERLTDLMELVTSIAFQKLDQRLAALLVARSNPILATHQALADELGSSREMISRLLKGFEEEDWVKLGREQIEVTNADALKNFAKV
jgi:CRP/FNR family transcriptional regulator